MAEVQNIGAVDYNQFQPEQYQTTPEQLQYTPDAAMDNMPAVYDETVEAKKAAGMGMVGATILGTTMLVVGGLIGKHIGSKGLDAAIKTANEAKAKADEAIKNYEKIQEATEKIEQAVKENNDKGPFGRIFGFQKMKDKISELIKPFKKEAPKAEEKVAEEAASAAKEGEAAAEEAAK